MSIGFRTGQYVDPSGFPLAVVNVPPLNPNTNISLTDNSYTWEENVTSSDSSTIESYVNASGIFPQITANNFLVTNIAVSISSNTASVPIYYKHVCRFRHYTYGNNPISQVVVTDSDGNVLNGLAYTVQVSRVAKYVYTVNVLTSFRNTSGASYKIRYNRCNSNGSNIYPNWTETLSVSPLFYSGSPYSGVNQYLLLGPDSDGRYTIIVPSVPTISPLVNTLGVSIVNSPAVVMNSVSNNSVSYAMGVTVTYTITAITSNTYVIMRDYDPATGNLVNNYLSSATSNTWGSATPFNTGATITGIPGVTLNIHTDNVLVPNDQAYFYGTTSYYYVNIVAYESIYLVKPVDALPDDDWYMEVANGSFQRTMDSNGNEVPVASGTTWQYSIPEYGTQVFYPSLGEPYMQAISERPELIDPYTLKLSKIPLYIDPSGVFNNPNNPGFPPYEYVSINLNGEILPETSIIDWDIDNGILNVGQIFSNKDNVGITYLYEQGNYVYDGYLSNMLVDGDFFLWTNSSQLTYWAFGGTGSLLQSSSMVYGNSNYSAEITATMSTPSYISQSYSNYLELPGQTVSLGAWVWCATASIARVEFADGVNIFSSQYHPGDSAWHYLSITAPVNSSPTHLVFYMYLLNNGVAYFDNASVNIGTSPTLYNELNLNPTPGLGWDIYAEEKIASIYAKPYYNATASGIVNQEVLYHNFTGVPSSPIDFKLGSISVGPNCSVKDVQITDTRSRGGGLNNAGILNLSTVENLQPESQFYWDVGYFDGQAVPADGVIVVNIPSSILTSNGGLFEKDEVKNKVYKHCALGTYCIIQFYNVGT